MSLRAPKDTIQSLRLMLQRLEQTADPDSDREARAELKRLLLSRIANLEALELLRVEALKSADRKKLAAFAAPKPTAASPIGPPQTPVPMEAAPRQPDPSDPVVTH